MSDTNKNKTHKAKRVVVTLRMTPEDSRLLRVLSAALDIEKTDLVASLLQEKASEHGLAHVLVEGSSAPGKREDRLAATSGRSTDGELAVVTDTAA